MKTELLSYIRWNFKICKRYNPRLGMDDYVIQKRNIFGRFKWLKITTRACNDSYIHFPNKEYCNRYILDKYFSDLKRTRIKIKECFRPL